MDENAASLLKTIQSDSQLRELLQQMPADVKTVTLSQPEDSSTFAHPGWSGPNSVESEDANGGMVSQLDRVSSDETILLPSDSVNVGTGDSADVGRLSRVSAGTPKQTKKTQQELRSVEEEGFVPQRRVASLNEGKATDAEYRLVGKLGSGGTGIVYQAHQRAIDREVAVKSLRDELAADPLSRERFLTEARVIGGLDHPNVIALHELCMDENGGLFYSMKRVDGASWDQRIDSMSLEENIRVLLRVADAIRYAHSRRLIHRDIKPENVMLGQYGEVLLADWGLAVSHRGEESSDRIVDTTIGGTPAYMAPELAVGDSRLVSFSTDVYLLGAVLFHVLTGQPPHYGKNLLACIHAAANNEIRPSDRKDEWMDIAMKAMQTDPKDRFASVDELIQAIEEQQVHRQSIRLVQRAERILQDASAEDHYEPFRIADAILREAIEAWPGNRRAHEAIADLQRNFASVAASSGDLDLAINLYEACGEGESEAAQRIRRARDQRNQHARGEAKYSVLFSRSPEAGLLTRLSDGEVLEANESFVELLGYPTEEVVGSRMSELDVWKCPEKRAEFVGKVREHGRVDNFEASLLHREGQTVNVLISAREAALANERVLLANIRDISARKKAESQLKLNRQRLRDLQRLAGLGTWSFKVETEEIEWSEEIFRLVKQDPGDGPLDFEEYLSTLHVDDREKLRRVVEETIQQGVAYEVTLRQGNVHDVRNQVPLEKRDYRTVIARGQPLVNEANEVVEVYGVLIPTARSANPPLRSD